MVGRHRGTKVTVFPTSRVVVLTSLCRSWISRRKATYGATEIGGLASIWNTTHPNILLRVTRLYSRNQEFQQCGSAQSMQTTSQAVSHEATLGAPAQRGKVTGKRRRFILRVIALAGCPTFLRTQERKIKLGDDTASVRSVFYRHGRNTQTFGEGKSDVFFPTVEIPNGKTTLLTEGINDFLHQKLRRRGARSNANTLLTR